MKKLSSAIIIMTLLGSMSCQRENIKSYHREGDVISFSAMPSTSSDIDTKASYSGVVEGTPKAEKIFWAEGDLVRIYCEQAEHRYNGNHFSDYEIKSVNSDRSSAYIGNTEGTNGLVWGSEVHDFYAVWPSPASSLALSGVAVSDKSMTGMIPAVQKPSALIAQSGNYVFAPDSAYMYMAAATENVNPKHSPDPMLVFKVVPTVLQFTVRNGFEGVPSVFISGAGLTSDIHNLSGAFSYDLEGGVGSALGKTAAAGNNGKILSIPTKFKNGVVSSDEDASPIELAFGKDITFTFFLYPEDALATGTSGLTLRLFVAENATDTPAVKSLKLRYSSSATSHTPGSSVTFAPSKKHILTGFVANGSFELTVEDDLVSWEPGEDEDAEMVESEYEYSLAVSGADAVDYQGGQTSFTVKSAKSNGIFTVPAAWRLEYSTDGGSSWSETAPEWVSFSRTKGNGSLDNETVTATVVAQTDNGETIYHEENHTTALRSKTPKSNFDLSLRNPATGASCAMTTANCYVVDAPGSYKLPLVYGNSISGGVSNTLAYMPYNGGTAPEDCRAVFKNHADREIIDPWIKNNYLSSTGTALISSATLTGSLIWQDQPGVITSVGIDGDYLTFSVSPSAIHECNAIVALKANGTVVWSWHIWITDEDLTVRGTAGSYAFMCRNLGQSNDGKGHIFNYDERTCLVRVCQTGGGKKTNVAVKQNSERYGSLLPDKLNNTYFQSFRKDPFLPADGYTNSDKKAYDISGTAVSAYSFMGNSNNSIGDCIKNPTIFYFDQESSRISAAERKLFNFWSGNIGGFGASYRGTTTQKTIYDPCPAGFKIPHPNAFFSTFKANVFPWNSYDKGRTLNNNSALFFPASGLRSRTSGQLSDVGVEGGAYTSVAYNLNQMYRLNFSSSDSSLNTINNAQCHGRPIRPIFE